MTTLKPHSLNFNNSWYKNSLLEQVNGEVNKVLKLSEKSINFPIFDEIGLQNGCIMFPNENKFKFQNFFFFGSKIVENSEKI